MSDKYLTVIRKWDFCGEDTVFDNDTSGKAVRYPTATAGFLNKSR